MARATYYDGLNAERYTAEVVPIGATSIRVTPSAGEPVEIDADELAVADEDRQHLLLSRHGMPGWRLAEPERDENLLHMAGRDAELLVQKDPELRTERGEAIRVLLALFERGAAVRTLRSG